MLCLAGLLGREERSTRGKRDEGETESRRERRRRGSLEEVFHDIATPSTGRWSSEHSHSSQTGQDETLRSFTS